MSQYTDEGYGHTGEWLMSAVKRNPEGLLLLAAGCALIMRTRSTSGQKERRLHADGHQPDESLRSGAASASSRSTWHPGQGISRAAASASEYASDIKDSVSESAGSYASSVADKASSYTSAAADYASSARRGVSEYSERLARQAQSTVQDTIGRVVRDQPLAVALAGLAAGAAVAAAFPTTDIERRTLGEAGERLTDIANRAGEQLKDGTSKAGEQLISSVGEHGLNADGLKEVARDVAGAFGSAFSGDQSKQAGGSSIPNGSSGLSSQSGSSGGSQAGQSGAKSSGGQSASPSGGPSGSMGQGGEARRQPHGSGSPSGSTVSSSSGSTGTLEQGQPSGPKTGSGSSKIGNTSGGTGGGAR
jgi:hypothetical protein